MEVSRSCLPHVFSIDSAPALSSTSKSGTISSNTAKLSKTGGSFRFSPMKPRDVEAVVDLKMLAYQAGKISELKAATGSTKKDTISLPKRPSITSYHLDKSQAKVAPVQFTSFIGKRSIPESEPAVIVVDPTSPTSVWRAKQEGFNGQRTKRMALLQPAKPHALPLGNRSRAAIGRRQISSSLTWRQELTTEDRMNTRTKMKKGFLSQTRSSDDYEVLLSIVVAMEEELLHQQSQSKQQYASQTLMLCDQIKRL